ARDDRDEELAGRIAREVSPQPVDGPLGDVEQSHPATEVHQVDGLVGCVLLLGHGGLYEPVRNRRRLAVVAGPRGALRWAGETGLEPAALRFGDGCSTVELLPYDFK